MKDITIYTSNTCPYCISAKDYLSKRGIEYTEKNVQMDPQAKKELIDMGYRGVPIIVVDGEQIVGFDKDRLDELLK
jgi:glutaredoxin 3